MNHRITERATNRDSKKSIAELDVPEVLKRFGLDPKYLGKELGREGFIHAFELRDAKLLEVTAGLRSDTNVAQSAWRRQRNLAQAPPTETSFAVGEVNAFWPPESRSTFGAVLFRRWNAVVRIGGAVSSGMLQRIALGIDAAILENESSVLPGIPVTPEILVQLPPGTESVRSISVGQSSKPVELPFSVEYEKEGPVVFLTPDVTIGRIRTSPTKRYLFFPSRPGRRKCTIVALAPTSVVASETFWIDVSGRD